jgi:hypothetical protein
LVCGPRAGAAAGAAGAEGWARAGAAPRTIASVIHVSSDFTGASCFMLERMFVIATELYTFATAHVRVENGFERRS